jgi:dethiobiotin synthetase
MTSTPHGIFVTGTDTGVGKTVVTAAIAAVLRAAGLDAVPMKPVQTVGRRRGGRLVSPDLELSLRLLNITPSARDRRSMVPYCFRPACSPHLAAADAGVTIDTDRILAAYRDLARRHDRVVVEGAGGVLVPIGDGRFMADLIVQLGLPVVLVARPGLGTLNHTFLSLRELARAGVPVLGVVFSAATPGTWGRIEADNQCTIADLGGVRVLGRVPFHPRLAQGRMSPAAFRELAVERLGDVLSVLTAGLCQYPASRGA